MLKQEFGIFQIFPIFGKTIPVTARKRSSAPIENTSFDYRYVNVKAIVKSTNAALPLVQRQKPQKKSFENVKYFCGPRAISPTK